MKVIQGARNLESGAELAYWLSVNQPELFYDLAARASIDPRIQRQELSGALDFLRNIGSSITGAVSRVGSYLTSQKGMETLLGLGTTYIAAKSQLEVLKTQSALAQSGLPPAPIQNVSGPAGEVVPVYTPYNQPVTREILASEHPSFIRQYGPLLALSAVGLYFFITAVRDTRS